MGQIPLCFSEGRKIRLMEVTKCILKGLGVPIDELEALMLL